MHETVTCPTQPCGSSPALCQIGNPPALDGLVVHGSWDEVVDAQVDVIAFAEGAFGAVGRSVVVWRVGWRGEVRAVEVGEEVVNGLGSAFECVRGKAVEGGSRGALDEDFKFVAGGKSAGRVRSLWSEWCTEEENGLWAVTRSLRPPGLGHGFVMLQVGYRIFLLRDTGG